MFFYTDMPMFENKRHMATFVRTDLKLMEQEISVRFTHAIVSYGSNSAINIRDHPPARKPVRQRPGLKQVRHALVATS